MNMLKDGGALSWMEYTAIEIESWEWWTRSRSISTLEGMVVTLAFILTALENPKKVLR